MRGRVARKAFALGSAGVVALAIAGCNQSTPEEEAAQTDLKIVEKVQIDENGAEVTGAGDVTPADPAGDGNAVCPPVMIAMMGALNGPDAALGINIKNGVQMAIDKHNAANAQCQVQLKAFDTEGDPRRPPVSHRRSSTSRSSSAWSAPRSRARPRPPVTCSTRPVWWRPPHRPPTSS